MLKPFIRKIYMFVSIVFRVAQVCCKRDAQWSSKFILIDALGTSGAVCFDAQIGDQRDLRSFLALSGM